LLAALGSWLDARKNGGKWLLRIEDLDSPRCIPGVEKQIQAQLLACGLSWDEELSYQSERQALYQHALQRLNQLKLLYPCTCSRQAIATALDELGIVTPRSHEMVYPGSCRSHQQGIHVPELLKISKVAWRLALPQNCHIEFEDLALGLQSQDLNKEVGDFVLRRNDGVFTYQLAVVVDDAEQAITHIVRGEDLLSNTARQIHLQKILGYRTPQYLHLPLVLNEHGEKLSKQTLATQINTQDAHHSLAELRKAAQHLRLRNLPDGERTTIAEWLLAATRAWKNK
jgi:glutamyl-Q tRNA(Asp) synthetase